MKKTKRNGFLTTVLVLSLFAACCCAGTAKSRTDLSVQETEGYYQEKEKGLVKDVKEFLSGQGFVHSGVMLTRVIEADGSREYTLTVHHGKIDRLDEESRQILMNELEEIIFEDGNCTFRHEFLINQ